MFKTINQRVSVILLLFAALYLFLSFQLPTFAYTNVDSDVLPKALGWLLVALAIGLFFTKDSETEEQKERRNISLKNYGMIAAVFMMILLYIVFFEMLGFIIVTGLFIYFTSWLLGYKKHVTNIIVSILFPLVVYYGFTEFLSISLPSGLLPF